VFEPNGTTPVPHAWIEVLQGGLPVPETGSGTRVDGGYALNLANGTYTLRAHPSWNNPNSYVMATSVITVSGGSVTAGSTNISLATANVTGTVFEPDGSTPVRDSWIEVRDTATGQPVGFTNTNSVGSFGLSLANGAYTLIARPSWNNPNGYVAGTRAVTVAGAPLANQNISLGTPNVSGTVVAADGVTPIRDSWVDVVNTSTNQYVQGVNAITSASGTYGLNLPNGTYRITAHPSWNNSAGLVRGSITVTVNNNTLTAQTITLGTPNVSGSVFAPNGTTPISNSYVNVFNTGTNTPVQGAVTSSSGTYSLALAPGTYRLTAYPSWNNPSGHAASASMDITVAGAPLTNQNLNLQTGNVSGVVRLADGLTPVANGFVQVFDAAGTTALSFSSPTRSDGSYSLTLPNGSYQLKAMAPLAGGGNNGVLVPITVTGSHTHNLQLT
jgi:hypothetical protein